MGSAAAEPAADDEEVAEGDAGGLGGTADTAFEDALPPKRRRYNRKRRPGQAAAQPAVDGEGAAVAELGAVGAGEAADREALLIPAHFAGAHVARVVRDGTGFRPILSPAL